MVAVLFLDLKISDERVFATVVDSAVGMCPHCQLLTNKKDESLAYSIYYKNCFVGMI